jgi:hypothetical protein
VKAITRQGIVENKCGQQAAEDYLPDVFLDGDPMALILYSIVFGQLSEKTRYLMCAQKWRELMFHPDEKFRRILASPGRPAVRPSAESIRENTLGRSQAWRAVLNSSLAPSGGPGVES